MAATLVVEDGTASAEANSFVSLIEFAAYCANRGYAITDYTPNQQTVALIKAGDYLRNEARFMWRGLRVLDEQSMPWPRSGAVVLYGTGTALATTHIPTPVKHAQCELAFKSLTTDLQPDLERGGGVSSVSAGGVSVSFRDDAMAETLVQVAQGVLKPYLRRKDGHTPAIQHYTDSRGYKDFSDANTEDGVDPRPSVNDTTATEEAGDY